MYDKNLLKICKDKSHQEYEHVAKVMQHLAVSHSVIKDNNNENSASSPDELAFIALAKAMGWNFTDRAIDTNTIKVQVENENNKVKEFKVL